MRQLLLLLSMLSARVTQAQTWDEWFKQKKTQLKYMTQQIAALETYGSYVKKGYAIASKGLGNIKDLTGGELGLHTDYYHSLKAVNPMVKNNPKAAAIVQYLAVIPGKLDQVEMLPGLNPDGQAYISSVTAKVLDECQADIAELELVLTSGQAAMTDDERLKRLDDLYGRVKNKYSFTLFLHSQVRMLLLQKAGERQSLQTLKNYYGIPE
ncbi:hypothetical protein [Mucilaginibacter sp.]